MFARTTNKNIKFTIMIYKFGVKYVTPVMELMLSNNRIYNRIPKNEIFDIHWRIATLVFAELLMPIILIYFIWARIYEPVSNLTSYITIGSAAAIACFFTYKIKREKICEALIKEANKLTIEQHKKKKALMPKYAFGYALTPVYTIILCTLFEYLIK